MDPFVTLANRYVDSRPGLGHSALPNAPQLPADAHRSSVAALLELWRRLLAGRSNRSRGRPVHARPTTGLPVRSPRMARGE
jgi:hypothetical protein